MTKNEFRQLLNKNTIKIDGLRLKIIELKEIKNLKLLAKD